MLLSTWCVCSRSCGPSLAQSVVLSHPAELLARQLCIWWRLLATPPPPEGPASSFPRSPPRPSPPPLGCAGCGLSDPQPGWDAHPREPFDRQPHWVSARQKRDFIAGGGDGDVDGRQHLPRVFTTEAACEAHTVPGDWKVLTSAAECHPSSR